MADSVIIIAGGKGKRWGYKKKYMLPVCEEPVLHRTVRLVKEQKGIDPHVIGEEHQEGANQACSYSSKFWSKNGMTYILLGDVSWKKRTLKRVLGTRGQDVKDFMVFGRSGANHLTGRPYSEIFAFAFPYTLNRWIKECHDVAIKIFPEGDWWDVLRVADISTRDIWALRLMSLLSIQSPKCITGLVKVFTYHNGLRVQGRTTDSNFFYDVGESVTDDFDEPEWYQPYLDAVEPGRLIDQE